MRALAILSVPFFGFTTLVAINLPNQHPHAAMVSLFMLVLSVELRVETK